MDAVDQPLGKPSYGSFELENYPKKAREVGIIDDSSSA
jgi:hypothetical protein